jgi:hypothetical protein
MAGKVEQVAEGFKTLQGLVKSSRKEDKGASPAVDGLFSSLKSQNPTEDVEKKRNDMLDWRQRKADSGFSQDTNLPAGKK